jgi:predicted NodU family carbamoyl transferase
MVDHHTGGHAPMAFFDSPFCSAMILSYDGGGNDGNFLLAVGSVETGIGVIGAPDASLNMGFSYEFFGTLMPEVYPWGKFQPGRWANSGTIMALAGLGRQRQKWLDGVHRVSCRLLQQLLRRHGWLLHILLGGHLRSRQHGRVSVHVLSRGEILVKIRELVL